MEKGVFTVDDIHKIRVEMAERHSKMSDEDVRREIHEEAEKVLHRMKKREMKMENKTASQVGISWKDFRKEICTPEEIAESNLKVAITGEIINAKERGLTPKDIEDISGIKQSIITHMQDMDTFPTVNTIIKFLMPFGKTLAVVPIEKEE